VKIIVDPTRYKQVLSYRQHQCYLAFFLEEEDLPCMLETTKTTVTGPDDSFATPRDIVDLAEAGQVSQGACSTMGCLENLLDTFTRKDI